VARLDRSQSSSSTIATRIGWRVWAGLAAAAGICGVTLVVTLLD